MRVIYLRNLPRLGQAGATQCWASTWDNDAGNHPQLRRLRSPSPRRPGCCTTRSNPALFCARSRQARRGSSPAVDVVTSSNGPPHCFKPARPQTEPSATTSAGAGDVAGWPSVELAEEGAASRGALASKLKARASLQAGPLPEPNPAPPGGRWPKIEPLVGPCLCLLGIGLNQADRVGGWLLAQARHNQACPRSSVAAPIRP